MFREEDKYNPYSPREVAKTGLKTLLLFGFMVISAVITVAFVIGRWSLWPFAGFLVAQIAFALLLEYLIPDNKSFPGHMLSGEKAPNPPSDQKP